MLKNLQLGKINRENVRKLSVIPGRHSRFNPKMWKCENYFVGVPFPFQTHTWDGVTLSHTHMWEGVKLSHTIRHVPRLTARHTPRNITTPSHFRMLASLQLSSCQQPINRVQPVWTIISINRILFFWPMQTCNYSCMSNYDETYIAQRFCHTAICFCMNYFVFIL